MGTNAKIHLELSHKTWPALGYSGATYGDWQRLACAWDDTVQLGPDASPALYLAFPGGRVGRTGLTGQAHGTAPARDVRLGAPPDRSRLPGHVRRLHGPRLRGPLGAATRGSAAPTPTTGSGRPRTTASSPRAADGRFLFAGEHTSIDNIGFLDGAVETGERAARQLFHRIGL